MCANIKNYCFTAPPQYYCIIVIVILNITLIQGQYCPKSILTSKLSIRAVCYYEAKQVPCNDRIRPGTEALLSCNTGFLPPPPPPPPPTSITTAELPDTVTHRNMTCKDDGTWEGVPFTCKMECGIVVHEKILRGNNAINVSEIPWHVGIYDVDVNGEVNSHICSGSIITPNLVISAAHCFWDENTEKLQNVTLFRVAAGKYFRDYDNADELYRVQKRSVSEIHIPSSFTGQAGNYEDDLAVVKLSSHLKFSDAIRPVCIDFSEVESSMYGKLTGWGTTEELQSVDMTTLSYFECARGIRSRTYDYALPLDKFCMFDAFRAHSACNDDGGAGFVISNKSSNGDSEYFNLVGIVSLGQTRGGCDLSRWLIMTNVKWFATMISNLITQSESEF